MVSGRKLTKLAKIGLSHSEKAKSMAAKGMYGDALSELKIALFSLRSENLDGALNEEIASVLNSIGCVNILLCKYREAADAFNDSVAIRKPMYNNPEVAGSLLGLAEAYRGLCDFDRAATYLEEALHVGLSLKNDQMAARVADAMDALERTRDNMPAAGHDAGLNNDLYMPDELNTVHAVLRSLNLDLAGESPTLSFIIGFPGLDRTLISRSVNGNDFPSAGLFFGDDNGVVHAFSVLDEEEEPVESTATPFRGLIFAPGSYHRSGPVPIPPCKKLIFAGGTGSLLHWKIMANSWYRVEASLDIKNIENGFTIALALPYHVKMSKVGIQLKKPLEYSLMHIDEGTFYATRSPERVSHGPALSYSFKRRLFEGSAFGALAIEANSSMKYAVIAFELTK